MISESQEKPLTLMTRVSLKFHVMMCAGCRNFGDHMGFLREAMRDYAKGKDEGSDK